MDNIFKYRVKLSKDKNSITHHEKRKMLRDALAASGLECALNKGAPRFNLGPGAGVGEASLCEYSDICLTRQTDIEIIIKKFAPHITGGFKIESIKEVPYMLSSVEVLAQYAKYNIKGIKGDIDKAAQSQKIEYEITHENGMREIKNIKPFIYSIRRINGEEVELIIKLEVLRSLGAAQILLMLPGLEIDEPRLEILRGALMWQMSTGALEAV